MSSPQVYLGNGVQTRFEVPGSVSKVVRVNGTITVPASSDAQSVTLPVAPGVGVPVQIDWVGTVQALVGTGLPAGGAAATVLAKLSSADGDAAWIAPVVSLGVKPSMGSVWGPTVFTGSTGVGTSGAAITARAIDQMVMAPFKFSGVKVLYHNYDTSNAVTINRAIAASAGIVSADGAALVWSEITFAGSATAVIPIATIDSGKTNPSWLLSDFIPVESIARTDTVGGFPILRVRTCLPDGSMFSGCNSTAALNSDASNPGFLNYSNFITTSAAALNSTAGSVYNGNPGNSPQSFLFYYSEGAYDLASFGDSLTAGSTTVSGYLGYPTRAAYLAQQQGKRLTSSVYAIAGTPHAIYCKWAVAYLAKNSPSFLSIVSWSPNDVGASTQAGMDAAWARTLNIVQLCKAQGVTPVVLTPFPSSGPGPTLMAQHIARVLALPSWVIKVDANAVLRSGTNTGAYSTSPAYNSDGVHTNDLGHGAVAQALVNALPI